MVDSMTDEDLQSVVSMASSDKWGQTAGKEEAVKFVLNKVKDNPESSLAKMFKEKDIAQEHRAMSMVENLLGSHNWENGSDPTGYASYYTKVTTAQLKGLNVANTAITTSASDAIFNTTTDLQHYGKSTNILDIFGVKNISDIEDQKSELVMEKGKPYYIVSGKVGDETKSTLVHIPNTKDDEVLDLANLMTTSKNRQVKAAGKMYVAANIMGDMWNSESIDLLKKESDPMPIFVGNQEIGEVWRNNDGYLEGKLVNGTPISEGTSQRFNKAADISVALYPLLARGRESGKW
jgi:hypothetical protein